MGTPVDLWYVARRDFNMNEALQQLGQDTLNQGDQPGRSGDADSTMFEF
jgi:hypothetical protein